jgi:uncharacterized membrane protein (DUF2068 family)
MARSIFLLMLRRKWNRTNSFRPRLITALSVFFLVGAAMSLTASISLFQPNSFLEPMWRLNIRAHQNLSSLGLWAVVMLSSVSALCAAAAIGLWRGSKWGYWLAIGLMATNLIGDVTNVVLGTEPRAIVGVPIVTAILAYLLLSKTVRHFFSRSMGHHIP